MFCGKCGKCILEEEAQFCPDCGHRIEQSSGKLYGLMSLILLLLVILVLVLWFVSRAPIPSTVG
jgi:hypothetical protein